MPQPQTRVAFIDHTAKMGGGEIALLNLVDNLRNTPYTPVVLLFSTGPLSQKLADLGIETHILPLGSDVLDTRKDSLGASSLTKLKVISASLAHAFRLRKLIKSLDVRIVHTNSLKADIIGGVAGRLARLPVVWHIRDRIDEDYLPRPVVLVFRWLCTVIPHFVIANSAATLKTINLPNDNAADFVPSGLSSNTLSTTLRVVHDGTPPVASAARSLAEAPLIGLIGRISPWKGQHIFLQAAATVLYRFPRARFQIIGSALFNESEYEKQLHELVDSLGIRDSVEFTGFREDVTAAIADLDVVVHASTSGEPFGQVVIEGMVAAKPIVATNGGGIPEIVVDGVTGLLVPMGDSSAMAGAISRILEDPALASRMGRLGRQRVLEHFTVSTTAHRVRAVYDRLLQNFSRPRIPFLRQTLTFLRKLVTSRTALRWHTAGISCFGVTLCLQLILAHFLTDKTPYFFPFIAANFIAALIAGVPAGLECLLLSIFPIAYFFIPHREWLARSTAIANLSNYFEYIVLSLFTIVLIHRFHRSHRQAEFARRAAENAEARAAFLSHATTSLALTASPEAVAAMTVYLATTNLADWAVIDLLTPTGTLARTATHKDPAKADHAERLEAFPPDLTSSVPIATVFRSGVPLNSTTTYDDATLEKTVSSPLHRESLKALGLGPFLVVPLVASARIIGTLTLVRSSPDPADIGAAAAGGAFTGFSRDDERLASELAFRAALALESRIG